MVLNWFSAASTSGRGGGDESPAVVAVVFPSSSPVTGRSADAAAIIYVDMPAAGSIGGPRRDRVDGDGGT